MKRMIYLTRFNVDAPGNGGVLKKVHAQLRAFQQNSIEAQLCFVKSDGLYVDRFKIANFEHHSKLRNYYIAYYRSLLNFLRGGNWDLVYIRFFQTDFFQLMFLKALKQEHPECRIVLELPTYPYAGEHSGWMDKLRYWMDGLCSGSLKKYVDRIVTYSRHEQIFDIPTIRSSNGIEILHDTRRDPRAVNEIILTAIANVSEWHAYDRLLRGMHLAKKNRIHPGITFRFHLVGSGSILDSLKELVKELDLGTDVVFYGNKKMEDISDLLQQTHLAVGTLGLHRIGIDQGSTLKSREYCAMGIPFLISTEDPDFPPSLPFVHYVASGESPVDMEDVYQYYKKIEAGQQELSAEMKMYARKNLTWERKIKEILQAVEQ